MSEQEAEADENAIDQDETSADAPVPVGVKLGSTRTVISRPGADDDPETIRSLTCIATYDDALTGEERVLYGEQAATEYADDAVDAVADEFLPELAICPREGRLYLCAR